MIPIILVSNTARKAETYITGLRKKYKITQGNVLRYKPEKHIITIDQIREIQSVTNQLTDSDLLVIYGFDTAKKESQNAILKTLEESGEKTLIILVVENYISLLPTILSRSSIKYADKLGSEKNKMVMDIDSFSSLEEALDASAKLKKTQYVQAVDNIVMFLRSKLRSDDVSKKSHIYVNSLKKSLLLKKNMIENNVNPEYSVDQLLISIREVIGS